MCRVQICMHVREVHVCMHVHVKYMYVCIFVWVHSDSNIFILCVEYIYVCMFMLSTCMYASSYKYIVIATYSQQDYTYIFIATRWYSQLFTATYSQQHYAYSWQHVHNNMFIATLYKFTATYSQKNYPYSWQHNDVLSCSQQHIHSNTTYIHSNTYMHDGLYPSNTQQMAECTMHSRKAALH